MAGGTGRFRHYQLAVTTTAQSLDAALPAGDRLDESFDWLDLQADDGNSVAFFIGADSSVTTAVHGVRIPAPVSAIPEPPFRIWGPLKLADIFVIAAAGANVNIFGKTF